MQKDFLQGWAQTAVGLAPGNSQELTLQLRCGISSSSRKPPISPKGFQPSGRGPCTSRRGISFT